MKYEAPLAEQWQQTFGVVESSPGSGGVIDPTTGGEIPWN